MAIDTAERSAISSKRIHNIIDHLTYEIYLYIQRGLFERHKIIFALLLAISVLTSAGKVSHLLDIIFHFLTVNVYIRICTGSQQNMPD